MRKILIALALIASVQIASAQSKSPAEAKKAVEAAELAAQNPKKAVKPATWLKVADAYVKAYDAPTGSVVAGTTKQELMFMMGNEKPTSTEEVVIGGQPYTKEVYANKDLYFNANGQLAIIDVTQPVYEDALAKAIEAYKKAAEVDPALSKGKDIRAGLELISGKYINDAYNCYQFGDYAEASVLFEDDRGIALFRQIESAAKTGGACADDGDLFREVTVQGRNDLLGDEPGFGV